MVRENSTETCTLPHVKQMTSVSSVHEAGHPNLVLRDKLEGWGAEGGGGGCRMGRRQCLWLIHIDVWQKPSQCCKVIILQLNK